MTVIMTPINIARNKNIHHCKNNVINDYAKYSEMSTINTSTYVSSHKILVFGSSCRRSIVTKSACFG